MGNKGSTPPLLLGVQTCTATMEINMVVPQKTENQSTLKPNYTILEHVPNGFFILPQEPLLNHIHCSFIHSSQRFETT